MEEKRNIPRNPRRRTPLQINRRLQGQLLSWLLVLLSFGFLITGLLLKDKEFSEAENRGLTQFPKLTFPPSWTAATSRTWATMWLTSSPPVTSGSPWT